MFPRLRIRDDLIVRAKDEDSSLYIVRDPRSGEVFEFGLEEWFLLSRMDGTADTEAILHEFKENFSVDLAAEQMDMLVRTAEKWGLLEESQEDVLTPPEATTAEHLFEDGALDEPPIASFPAGKDPESVEEIWDVETEETLFTRQGSSRAAASTPWDHAWRLVWIWFDPSRVFLWLSKVLSPLRHLIYAVPVLVIIGVTVLFNNFDAFIDDFLYLVSPLSVFFRLLLSMLMINLAVEVGRGIVSRGVGAEVDAFGIKLMLGFIPRFGVRVTGLGQLDKGKRLWVYGSALLIRLALFGVANVVWVMGRQTGTQLSFFALLLICMTTWSFLLSATPLLRGDGYRVLTILLEMPYLKEKANRALFAWFARRTPRDESNLFALRAYALASLIFIAGIVGVALVLVGRWLELNYQGTGVVIFLFLFGYLLLRFRRQVLARRARLADMKASSQPTDMKASLQPTLASRQDMRARRGLRREAALPARTSRKRGKKRRWLKYLVLGALAVVLILPYPYETGGPLSILPLEHQDIAVQTPGVIEEVAFNGGERVPKGTLLARLSSWTQEKDVITTREAIGKQAAELKRLLTTPLKEDLQIAQRTLETARKTADYSRESAKRKGELHRTGYLSDEEYAEAEETRDVDEAKVLEAQATLADVKAGYNPAEIEAARAEVRRLQGELKYHEEELAYTRVYMPIDGRIVTNNLKHMLGRYLETGGLFASVENDRVLRVEIEIPESDVAEVAIGAKARIKIWAFPTRIFESEVTEIMPVVQEQERNRVVVVAASLPNPDGLLKAGATGFGKINGGTKPVIVAFTRMLVRFFLIEMWSWIP